MRLRIKNQKDEGFGFDLQSAGDFFGLSLLATRRLEPHTMRVVTLPPSIEDEIVTNTLQKLGLKPRS